MGTALFFVITQRVVVISYELISLIFKGQEFSYRRFGTTYRPNMQGLRIGLLKLEDETDRLSRNVCKKLPLHTA